MSICEGGGLGDNMVFACNSPLPADLGWAFAVATDDLRIFSDVGEGTTVSAAKAVEGIMIKHGIARNAEKDVDDSLSTTCVGVDLVHGRFWCTSRSRWWSFIDALWDLVACGVGSRGAVASFCFVACSLMFLIMSAVSFWGFATALDRAHFSNRGQRGVALGHDFLISRRGRHAVTVFALHRSDGRVY